MQISNPLCSHFSEAVRNKVYFVYINFRYQRESEELSHWLQSALDRLEFWTTQSVTVPQELETVRDHLYAFLVSLVIKWVAKMHCRPNSNILIAVYCMVEFQLL